MSGGELLEGVCVEVKLDKLGQEREGALSKERKAPPCRGGVLGGVGVSKRLVVRFGVSVNDSPKSRDLNGWKQTGRWSKWNSAVLS
ncbi:hypothetical protein AVEN_64424-1 [Araneus ventricosus]|uniref:Uncharacterized protein n=1 Tax=Araneus ventricosus TaxID=182803 RepID=A0A4Y2VGZ5_ARAVE|nr:hypothetical protein AVEN_80500-1 [Araneus ventricosus]GBO23586.1 hypothetical protein AVEN_64424-1 [Araneus ventricosus]